jgi:hypothetical protein
MGYRSDVGLCLNKQAEQSLQDALLKLDEHNEDTRSIRKLFEFAEKRQDDESGAAVYFWEWFKWYPEFSEVAFVESFLSDLEEGSHLFIRVGESDDDSECRGAFWENPFGMRFVREIAFA